MSNANDKTVSQKMIDLQNLVSWFESDEFELEKAISKYKDAEKLATEIEGNLNELKNEVTVLKQKFE